MVIALFPLLLAVGGALLYALAGNAKLSELGRIMFFVGLFWFASTLATHAVQLG
jgi:Na+/phosphate symporter